MIKQKVRSAVEETLRLNSPVQLIPRQASEDCRVGGIFIPKGPESLLLTFDALPKWNEKSIRNISAKGLI